ncbi:amino acid racemase [candidate division KSB1 bacterium]|nr:amino acid racemase [candidate division KSB1 bacterium]
MNTLGIIGGVAPESTIEYYRLLVNGFLDAKQDGNYPNIIINSINMKKMLDLIAAGELEHVTDYLVDEVQKLARAGATIGLLASNTPHIVFDAIRDKSPIPLISIVEATCEHVNSFGLNNVGLLGTRSTMQRNFYQDVFTRFQITVVTPDDTDQLYIHDRYIAELVKGIFRDDTHEKLQAIVHKLIFKHHIKGLILGGTELPFILKENDKIGIPFFDTAKIHVKAALKMII